MMKIICTLSILFTLTILGGLGYLYFADPFGINSLLFPEKNINSAKIQNINSNESNVNSLNNNNSTSGTPINLSVEQKASLEKIGIDTTVIPDVIPPETEKCFIEKLGEKRVNEIKAGANLGALDLLKAKTCLE
jgi:hypothetical protein